MSALADSYQEYLKRIKDGGLTICSHGEPKQPVGTNPYGYCHINDTKSEYYKSTVSRIEQIIIRLRAQ